MIRTLTLAALAATAFALPAAAAETGNVDANVTNAYASELAGANDAKQAVNILASRGYVNISSLERDANGRWTGTAMKDGKTQFVAVSLPKPHDGASTN